VEPQTTSDAIFLRLNFVQELITDRRCFFLRKRLAVQMKKSLVKTQATAGKSQLILFEYLTFFKA
jgi:hypothetical protein